MSLASFGKHGPSSSPIRRLHRYQLDGFVYAFSRPASYHSRSFAKCPGHCSTIPRGGFVFAVSCPALNDTLSRMFSPSAITHLHYRPERRRLEVGRFLVGVFGNNPQRNRNRGGFQHADIAADGARTAPTGEKDEAGISTPRSPSIRCGWRGARSREPCAACASRLP